MKKGVVLNFIVVSVFSSLVLTGCLKSEDPVSAEEMLARSLENVNQAQLQTDLAIIDDSLEQWSITPLIEPNGVRYVVNTEGTGPTPTLNSTIVINYKGKLLKNQSVFEQATNVPLPLRSLIIGWQTTLPLIKEGSQVTLYIPSGFAYGTRVQYDADDNVSIPANSNLVFDITLVDVY